MFLIYVLFYAGQALWGVLSDKSKSKNQIVGMLLLICSIVGLAFYASKTALWLALCVLLFNVFFNPAVTLQDNYTLEMLEGGKWDFGTDKLQPDFLDDGHFLRHHRPALF